VHRLIRGCLRNSKGLSWSCAWLLLQHGPGQISLIERALLWQLILSSANGKSTACCCSAHSFDRRSQPCFDARRVSARLVARVVETAEPLLVVLLGPTGSGKTLFPSRWASVCRRDRQLRLGGVYRGMEIGSAKPSVAQRALIPHHLLDVVAPDMVYTAGDYSRDARLPSPPSPAAVGCRSSPAVPVSIYAPSCWGCFLAPKGRRFARPFAAQSRNPGACRVASHPQRLDPASAERIHVNDVAKVVRAIEVTLAASRPMSKPGKTAGRRLRAFACCASASILCAHNSTSASTPAPGPCSQRAWLKRRGVA